MAFIKIIFVVKYVLALVEPNLQTNNMFDSKNTNIRSRKRLEKVVCPRKQKDIVQKNKLFSITHIRNEITFYCFNDKPQ